MLDFHQYYELLWEAFDTPTQLLLNPDNNSKTWQKVYDEFEASGGYMLGSGAFGATFFHPSWPYVLKTFADDEAYLKYIRWMYSQPSNPAFPKIYGTPQKIVPNYIRPGAQKTMYAIRMEKLEPLSTSEFDSMQNIMWSVLRGGDVPQDPDISKHANFLNTMKKVYDMMFHRKWGSDDLHSGNIMKRPSTGEWVITDPVANFSKHPKKPLPFLRDFKGGKAHPTRRERFKMKRDAFKPGDKVRVVGDAYNLDNNKVYTVLEVELGVRFADVQYLTIENERGFKKQFPASKFVKVGPTAQ